MADPIHDHHHDPAPTQGMAMTHGSASMMTSSAGMLSHTTPGTGGMGHGSGDMMSMMMMKMFFHFTTDTVILFKGWATNGVGSLIGSMIAVLVFGFLFEVLRTWRDITERNSKCRLTGETAANTRYPWPAKDIAVRTGLHMLYFTWSYMLMLVVMTFNAWLFFSVLLGVGAGHFVFLPFRSSLRTNPSQPKACCNE